MKPLILLDFDGVLFNSAYEAFQVCENLAKVDDRCRNGLTFEEFMRFRAHLTDAWQFCRLYQKDRVLRDFAKLNEVEPDEQDWNFASNFFSAREVMIKNPEWAKLMSPYPFFHQLRPMLVKYPHIFKILSTRNKYSIQRTLEFFESDGLEIYGQEDIRKYGSKLGVSKQMRWLESNKYVVYIDDMNSHLEPFESEVDLCIHAGWGYDLANTESYTQEQAFQIISALVKISEE
jgi:hypothetical protein